MRPLQKDLEHLQLASTRSDQMPNEKKREWLMSKMDTIHQLREEGFSFDDIGIRYLMAGNSLRLAYRVWLIKTGKTDPRDA